MHIRLEKYLQQYVCIFFIYVNICARIHLHAHTRNTNAQFKNIINTYFEQILNHTTVIFEPLSLSQNQWISKVCWRYYASINFSFK